MTREGNGSDCEMHPRFEVGGRYLIFLDGSHWRAFERIDRPDDRWLRAVKAREVLFGKVPGAVRVRSLIRGPVCCRPGLRVVGVIHKSSAFPGHTERRPPARLLPLNADGVVDFDGEPSEAVIAGDGPVTLDALRALAAARRGH